MTFSFQLPVETSQIRRFRVQDEFTTKFIEGVEQ